MSLAGKRGGARLSDAGSAGRCLLSAGRLKLEEYRIALTAAEARGVVLDLRGLRDADHAKTRGVECWVS
jgi:hypothetical protein